MAKPAERRRRPSADEAALFERAMRGARRLPASPAPAAAPPPPAPASPRRRRTEQPPSSPSPAPLAPPAPVVVVARRAMVPGLDRRTLARLARGALPIEARLDLHGYRQADAHRALRRFVLDSHDAGRRCLLVVTGKGQTGGGAGEAAPGVLRRNLPRWLAEPPLADKVLAIRPALPQHGGEGACYLLLRRRRA